MSNKKIKDIVLIAFSFVLFMLIEKNVISAGEGNEDQIFAEQIIEMGLFNWCKTFYLNWSGRVFLTAIDALLLNQNLIIWKILNAFVFTQMVYMIKKITNSNLSGYLFVLLFMAMPSAIIANCDLWITGSFNYLWPTSFMFVLIYLTKKTFNGEKLNITDTIYGLVACMLAGGQEQTGIVAIVFILITIGYMYFNKKKFNKQIVYIFIFLLVNYLFVMLAPGNYARSASELLQWNSGFDTYTMFDKIFSGLFLGINYLNMSLEYLMIILCLIPIIKNYKEIYNYIPSILFVVSKLITYRLDRLGLYEPEYYPYLYDNMWMWILFFIRLCTLLAILYFAIKVFENENNKLWMLIVLSLALLSSAMLGFSPTIYASGKRVFYVMIVLIIYGIIEMLQKIITGNKKYVLVPMILVLLYISYGNVSLFLLDNSFLYLY